MATVVFQSSTAAATTQPPVPVESQFLMEPPPLTLRLKLASPSITTSLPSVSGRLGAKIGSPKSGAAAWSFLEVLSPRSSGSLKPSRVSTCHPPPPPSPSCCLEHCTENLGNETGCTDIAEPNLFSSVSCNSDRPGGGICTKHSVANKKAGPRRTFPPPLTTMCGREPIHFRPHRGGGRMVLEAIRSPPDHSCLQAERSQGRLRLFFQEERPASAPAGYRDTTQEEEVDCIGREEQEEEESRQGGGDGECLGGDTDEKNDKFGAKIGKGELFARKGRSRRCTEGGGEVVDNSKSGRLMGWGSFLVATS